MGFTIFASGANKFHMKQENCIDDKAFDTADLLAKLQGMEPSWMGAAATGVDIVQPSAGIIDLMKTMATMEFLHRLSNAVCYLAMNASAADGWIFVSARQSHLMWPDSGGNAKYKFQPGISPGAEFIKKISPALKEADLAHWGALRMLGICLTKFASKIDDSTPPIININLSH